MRIFRALQAKLDLSKIQGDLFSRGFPKFNETYYFFSIKKPGDFSKALRKLARDGKSISTLQAVIGQWEEVDKLRGAKGRDLTKDDKVIKLSNALIGFSSAGLKEIRRGNARLLGIGEENSDKDSILTSDPAFYRGMKRDGPMNLSDPPTTNWDRLFQQEIHGVLKVAGSDETQVEDRLDQIKGVLGYGTGVIADIVGDSAPTKAISRVDGASKPHEGLAWGHEHFGYRDGISQPLMKGIDLPEAIEANPFMDTPQDTIIVKYDNTPQPGNMSRDWGNPSQRPQWMENGSFLVFRKLEQHVGRFQALLKQKYSTVKCSGESELAAKLMGRWPEGTPIADGQLRTADSVPTAQLLRENNFKQMPADSKQVCPTGAHIRKMNPRSVNSRDQSAVTEARILRKGIPYGTPYTGAGDNPDVHRGLLFACYQSSIGRGFWRIQSEWANEPRFPLARTNPQGPGLDPFIGQSEETALGMPYSEEDEMKLFLNDTDKQTHPRLGPFGPLVTMRGGEYFFVPSIDALADTLGSP
ncbi:hypothetical protein B0T25DRAFT_537124 [Lasiosphaeria hispida]|uniref:Dyp-type peroxidase n=1 Tax=Lasiosphaeria hispida TaxID=260671 RepID=A0AAJ0HKN8_9PEZI|nr:hypothetical protein B0T25DRAFT_537124 [Lasiosphaeria hispida]